MRVRSLLVLLALIAALFLVKKLFFPSRQGPSGPPPGKGAPVVVNVKVVQPVYFEELVRSTGTILANEEVTLKAELSGRITGLFFKEGQAVEKGALMVKINDAELQAQLARVKLNLKLAEQRLERNRKLMEMQGISQEEFDRLQNEVETLRAERDLVLAQLEKSEIRAPFSGVAGLRQVSEGALVSSQQSIATLQQLNPLKLEFSLPEQYLGRVQSGDTVRYTNGSRQQEFDALVYAVEPLVDPATRSIRIRAYSAGTGGKVLPGAFASVR
ncbi:MAG: efflux RND transporter periplasmic adaptor subunit, partial [Bacteroidia bacterium]|nr:efflux RND transporter periplasmic adaptor subunit [Bacteroidia bacterium]